MDWTSWFFLVLGLILAYLLEFTRPWVKFTIGRSIISSKQKRIETLIKDYKYLNRISNSSVHLNMFVVKEIVMFLLGIFGTLFTLGYFVMIVAFGGGEAMLKRPEMLFLYYFFQLLIIIVGLLSMQSFLSVTAKINSILKPNEYKEETIKKIIKLGGNPEDLDKEE